MGSEIPHHLTLVMVHSLMIDRGDPKFKNDVLQHLLGMCGFVWVFDQNRSKSFKRFFF